MEMRIILNKIISALNKRFGFTKRRISRTIAFVLAAMLAIGGLTGCAKEKRRALNIIDDNYRTWYEVFLYSFYDSDGNGIGDINGLIKKLDYINDNDPDTDTDLGCNGIWLMPVMPSATYHKYDVIDYYDIDKEYGTLEDFQRLLEECHNRGINVILDLVMNHTSAKHMWFLKATGYLQSLPEGEEPSEEECPYFGYYNFVRLDGAKNGYYKVSGTEDWYYEAMFWDQMPDLNLKNENVRREFQEIADFWLDMGVDGFRLDAAKEFVSGSVTDNVEILTWFNDYVKSVKPDCYLVAEVWTDMATFSQYYASGIDSVFNYSYGAAGGRIAATVKNIGKENVGTNLANAMVNTQETLSAYNPDYIDASFLNNHDNARAAGYVVYKPELVKLMGGINLMMPGSSFIYYGEEIGMKGSGKKDEDFRAPMLWSLTDTMGITSGPSGMDPQESKFEGVDGQLADKESILNYYIKAVRLRNENPEIARGVVSAIGLEDSTIAATARTYNDSTIYVLYNLSDTEKTLTFDKETYGYKELVGYLTVDQTAPSLKKSTLTIPPYGIVILK